MKIPASMFVADFMGLTNCFPGTATAMDGDQVKVRLTIGLNVTATARNRSFQIGQPVNVFIKPEAISLTPTAAAPTRTVNCFEGSILQRSYEGALLRYKALVGEEQIDIYAINTSENRFAEDSEVRIYLAPEGVVVISADEGKRDRE